MMSLPPTFAAKAPRSGLLLLVLAALLATPAVSYAQDDDESALRRVNFYRFVEPGQATMRVAVWGDVTAPGRYEIVAGTDLLDLLFLAGGTSEGVRRTNERRTSTVRVSRKMGDVWSVVFEAPLDAITAQQRPYPNLQDGDALKVDTVVRRTFGWRDTFTVIGAVGTLVLVAERLSRLSE